MKGRIVGALIAAAMLTTPGSAADLGDLLSRVEKTYGGSEAVQKIGSYRVEGRTQSRMHNATGELVREYRSPDRLKVVIEYPSKSEVRVLDGEYAWRGAKTGVHPVEGPMRSAMDYQLLRSDLPGVLLRNRDRLTDGGVKEHEGGRHRIIVLAWSKTVEMRYRVDLESFRITQVESVLNMGGRTVIFATSFDDFRLVDGVLFPFRETNYASGAHVADTFVDRVVLDPEELEPFLPLHPPMEPTRNPGELDV